MTRSKPAKNHIRSSGKSRKTKPADKKQGAYYGKIWIWLAGILLLTFLAYLPSLDNGFVWDDLVYIQKNPLIYTVDLSRIFSSYLAGNYHPLTVLVHALEFQVFELNPRGYHAVNLTLHLLNTGLVFYFIWRLSGIQGLGLLTALLFGIHPLHVESVAWVSELKDLLYTFFFLGSLIAWLHYLDERQKKWMLWALLLFLLSLLSKGMAVALPLVLLLIDYTKGRLMGLKGWVEKWPFFLLSFSFGIIAVFAQQSEKALHADVIPWMQRIVFACYSFVTYLQKLVIPFPLSAYYPYPVGPQEAIPAMYYLFIPLLILIGGLTWYSLKTTKKIFFGLGFFAITIFLVLKLLPVGYAVMADRYSYVPSIGILFVFSYFYYKVYHQAKGFPLKISAAALMTALVVFYSYTTYTRTMVWENGHTLWSDVIEKNDRIAIAFLNRGVYLMEQKQYGPAEQDLSQAVALNPNYADAYYNRGIMYQNTQRADQALADYDQAIRLNPNTVKAYVNRGNIFRDRSRFEQALSDYDRALKLDPDILEAYNNKGILLQNHGHYEEALIEYSKALQRNPGYVNALINRGNVYGQLQRNEEALKDFNQAIALNPSSGMAYYARGLQFIKLSDSANACNDFNKAAQTGHAAAKDALAAHCR